MKKFILLLLMTVAMTVPSYGGKTAVPLKAHESGSLKELGERDRNPIRLPIVVYFDSDTNILEVWCDDDNIQAEVYVYDETGAVEAYSAYMNVTIQLSSSNPHSVLIKGDGWEGEAYL